MKQLNLITNENQDLAIVQGATYDKLILKIEGDYSDAIFKAEIRDNILESGGNLLATFGFEQISYDSVNNRTTVVPILTASQTSQIPFTKFDGIGEPSRRNCWVWDMEAIKPNNRKPKIIQLSLVQVIAEVTD